MKTNPTAKKRFWLRILLVLGAVFWCLVGGEIVVRVLGHHDTAGNFLFRGHLIRPLRLPLDRITAQIAALQITDASVLIYHPVLGWAPRPGSHSDNGLYHYNSRGLRSAPHEFSDLPTPGVLRVALFGDSFTHGNDVPYEQSFGAILEEAFNAAGVSCEVLNFGVGGYGTDQAMLRYHEEGKHMSPHLVVFGFQPENIKRNLNLLRPLYDPRSEIPFAKPRFVLAEGRLALINVPVLPPDHILPTLRNLEHWDLRSYEHFYDPGDYRGTWWRRSKLLATTADLMGNQDDPWFIKRVIYRRKGEEQPLAGAIIQAFADEVAGNAAQFMIVHLPTLEDLQIQPRLGRFPYQSFLDALDNKYHVVRAEQPLLAAGRSSGFQNLFHGHYTLLGNRLVARAIFDYLVQQPAEFWEKLGVELDREPVTQPGMDSGREPDVTSEAEPGQAKPPRQ